MQDNAIKYDVIDENQSEIEIDIKLQGFQITYENALKNLSPIGQRYTKLENKRIVLKKRGRSDFYENHEAYKRFKEWYEGSGYTPKDLEKILHMKHTSVHNYINGKSWLSPSAAMLLRLHIGEDQYLKILTGEDNLEHAKEVAEKEYQEVLIENIDEVLEEMDSKRLKDIYAIAAAIRLVDDTAN